MKKQKQKSWYRLHQNSFKLPITSVSSVPPAVLNQRRGTRANLGHRKSYSFMVDRLGLALPGLNQLTV